MRFMARKLPAQFAHVNSISTGGFGCFGGRIDNVSAHFLFANRYLHVFEQVARLGWQSPPHTQHIPCSD
jgi:hypothetical protein